jgi:hypothetical protein
LRRGEGKNVNAKTDPHEVKFKLPPSSHLILAAAPRCAARGAVAAAVGGRLIRGASGCGQPDEPIDRLARTGWTLHFFRGGKARNNGHVFEGLVAVAALVLLDGHC